MIHFKPHQSEGRATARESARRSASLGLGLCLALVGCVSPGPAPPGSESHIPREVRAALAACVPEIESGPWKQGACGEACYVRGNSKDVSTLCARIPRSELEVTRNKRGVVRISGTLVCRRPPGDLKGVVVVTTTPRHEGEPPRELGRVVLDLRPDAVDPVPLNEDFRLPFVLNLAEGLPLTERVSLLGLVTSQDGPTVAAFLRISF